ncbi:hypothetical protein ABKV19_024762 [Rosa sericea]
MEELGSIWTTTYQESTDELKNELMYSSLELESVKCKVTESQENVTNLLNLLEVAYKERDEARDQLKKIFEKMNPNCTPIDQLPNHVVQPVSPQILMPTTTKENLSLTESNSPSSVDSLFDHAVSSPEFPSIIMPDSSTMGFVHVKQPNAVQQFNLGTTNVTMSAQTDIASEIVNDFAKGKTLPQKGKLMQAVKEAGPLLRTLLIAGPPLPQWRNPPPPLQQPFKIPPVAPINGCTTASPLSFNQKPFAISNPTTSYFNVAHTSSAANAMLSFNTVLPSAGVSCFNNSRMMETSNSGFNHQIPFAKRRRLQ